MKRKLFQILILIGIVLPMQAQTLSSFTKVKDKVLMYNYEVSVNDYIDFLDSEKNNKEHLFDKTVFLDSAIFGNQTLSENFSDKYFSKENGFANYPIVGVTASQAEEFCKWMEAKLNSSGQFKGKVKGVRLPTIGEYYSILLKDTIQAVFNPSDNRLRFERSNEMTSDIFTNLTSIDLTKTISDNKFKENLSGFQDGYVHLCPVNAYSGGNVNLIGNVSEFVYSNDRKDTIIPIGNNFAGRLYYQGKLSNPEYALYDSQLLSDTKKWAAASAKIGFRFVVILN